MRDGRCPRCGSTAVYAKRNAFDTTVIDGKRVETDGYLCTSCGFMESYVSDKGKLDEVVRRAEKLGDWKRVG